MISKLDSTELLKMIVGLKQVGDLDVVSSEVLLSKVCTFEERPKVLRIASLVGQMFDTFDYELSPEFLSKIEGKTAEVQAMHKKLISQDRRKQLLQRFGKALAELLVSTEAYCLVPPNRHDMLDELRSITLSISN